MLRAQGFDLDKIAERVGELLDMEVGDGWAEGKHRTVVKARSLLCYWAVKELGVVMSTLGGSLNISTAAVSQSVLSGEELAKCHQYKLMNNFVK